MSAATARVGVMVVRVWVEPSDGEFRARLTHTRDLSERGQTSDVAGTPDEVVAAVRAWVEAFVTEAV